MSTEVACTCKNPQMYKKNYKRNYKFHSKKQDTYVSKGKMKQYEQLLSQGYSDYIEYSRKSVLQDVQVYFNQVPKNVPSVVAFDTEGTFANKKGCALAQLATDDKTVYLFTDFSLLLPILENPEIKKLVFASGAETQVFPTIQNVYDLQYANESFTSLLENIFGVLTIKNKMIHSKGWVVPFTQDQLDYAVADVVWTMHLHLYPYKSVLA
jgi:hypothetical protein